MRVETPPYLQIVEDAGSLTGLENFFNEFFGQSEAQTTYVSDVIADLNKNPQRSENPDYLKFLARVLLMCAEYGFPETRAHKRRYENDKKVYLLENDYLHPLYLLEVARYLSGINTKSIEYKTRAVDYWRNKLAATETPPSSRAILTNQIWGHYTLPEKGEVEFPPVEDFLRITTKPRPGRSPNGVFADRIHLQLPLVMPEPGVHYEFRDLEFNPLHVDTVTPRIFQAGLQDRVQAAFGGYADIARAFMYPDSSGRLQFC